MYYKLIFLYLTVNQVFSAPPVNERPCDNKESSVIPIVSQSEEYDPNGAYRFSYETGNGIKREESAFDKVLPKHTKHSARHENSDEGREDSSSSSSEESDEIHVQRGSYSYTAPDGTLITVNYIADENGFRPTIIQHSKKSGETDVTSTINEKSGRQLHTLDSTEMASAPTTSLSNSGAALPIPKIEARNFEKPAAATATYSATIPVQSLPSNLKTLPPPTPSSITQASSSVHLVPTEKASTTVSDKNTEGVSSTTTQEEPLLTKTTLTDIFSPSELLSTVPFETYSTQASQISTESSTVVRESTTIDAIGEQHTTLPAAPEEPSTVSTNSVLPEFSTKATSEETKTTATIEAVTAEKVSATESSPTTNSEDVTSTELPSTSALESTFSTTILENTTEHHLTTVAEDSSSSVTSSTTSEESSTNGEPSTTSSKVSYTTEIPSTTSSEEYSTTEAPSTTISQESFTSTTNGIDSSTNEATTTSIESSTTEESQTTHTTAFDDSATTVAASTTETEVTSTTETNSTTPPEENSTTGIPSTTEPDTPTTSQNNIPTTEITRTTST